MNARERWQRTFHFQPVDRVPNYEFGYWKQCYEVWHKQGLPEHINSEREADAFFGLDKRVAIGPPLGLLPPFQPKVLERRDDVEIVQDGEGIIYAQPRSGEATIPHYLSYPIKDKASWEEYKERLNPATPGRRPAPEHLQQLAEKYNQADYPVGISIGSLIGTPRNRIGVENLAYLLYDDPELVEEIVETQFQLIIQGIKPYLELIRFDYAHGWEDICFNNGPLISPAMLRELLLPRYKAIADLLHQYGVDVIFTDCDGNINALVPIWLEAGYNCMFPIEVRAGSDPVALRREYGRQILLLGGFDKMCLLQGKEAVLAELRRLEPVIAEGGFIPHVDHRVPADVPLDTYLYYHREKRAFLGY
ncbi:MAG TPA: hypothetical protein GXX29_10585 [Firmicutes bacterium]|nr:hypothetical protein [Bacillota bacterium]